jgi:class 3 adenylate cyclase
MEKQIRFCTASDGVRIAYTTYGSGYPLIFVPGWVSHLDIDAFLWDFAVEGLLEATGHSLMVARYDKRGTGLSQRGNVGLEIDDRIKDIEAVAAALKLKRFALTGVSEGGPIAMAYAARYPRKVSHLIVYGGFAHRFGGDTLQSQVDGLLQLIRLNWELATDVFSARLLAGATPEDMRAFGRLQQAGVSAGDAAALFEMNTKIDLRDQLPAIKAQTLVVHGRNDDAVPFELGREMAQLIPNARLYAHDGGHYPAPQYRAAIWGAMGEFLRDVAPPPPSVPAPRAEPALAASGLTTIVFTDIERNTQILDRLGDSAWRELLREHERITREQLGAHGGKEIKTIGDAFMASFASPMHALECAIALQRAFAKRNESVTEPLMVRVGVNTGEPIAEGGDLYGASVTMASRIVDKAAGGEIVVSNVVRELAAGKGFLFSDRGDVVLRGFEDPARLYEVRWRDA